MTDRRNRLTRKHEARVDQSVKHFGGALDQLVLLLRQSIGSGGVRVQNQVERVVVVGDLGSQSRKVEVVLDVVLVDLK